jgi:hypothetical protein
LTGSAESARTAAAASTTTATSTTAAATIIGNGTDARENHIDVRLIIRIAAASVVEIVIATAAAAISLLRLLRLLPFVACCWAAVSGIEEMSKGVTLPLTVSI